jgi:hypothetical protein
MMPVLEKMLDSVSNCGRRDPNTSQAAARTSFWKSTLGGREVASDTIAASGIKAALGIAYLQVVAVGIGNIRVAGIFREAVKNREWQGSLKGEICPLVIGRDHLPSNASVGRAGSGQIRQTAIIVRRNNLKLYIFA